MIIPFHALPISREETDFRLNKDEFNFILNEIEYRDSKSYSGGVKLSKGENILEHQSMKRINKFIIDNVINFKNNTLQVEDDFIMTQSWTTINDKGNSHHQHNHPNTILSCVYYARASSGDFVIKTPSSRLQEGFNLSYKIKQQNIFNCNAWSCEVKDGVLIIFPGHLNHFSLPNENDESRIMIGANFFLKKIREVL